MCGVHILCASSTKYLFVDLGSSTLCSLGWTYSSRALAYPGRTAALVQWNEVSVLENAVKTRRVAAVKEDSGGTEIRVYASA